MGEHDERFTKYSFLCIEKMPVGLRGAAPDRHGPGRKLREFIVNSISQSADTKLHQRDPGDAVYRSRRYGTIRRDRVLQ